MSDEPVREDEREVDENEQDGRNDTVTGTVRSEAYGFVVNPAEEH